MKKERQGRQGKTPEGTGTGENSSTHPSTGQGSKRERQRRDERRKDGITTEQNRDQPPPGKEDRGKDRRKREEGKAGADQNRTDQNKGKNEDTTRDYRKRIGLDVFGCRGQRGAHGKKSNSMR